MTEQILSKEEKRYTLFPLRYPDLEKFRINAESQFWVANEVDLSQDKFEELSNTEKEYLKNILAFFSGSDIIVNENIDTNFLSAVEVLEIKRFYNLQLAIEDIHSHAYSLLIDTYIKDPVERDKMFFAVEKMPFVKSKTSWAFNWLGKGTFTEKLVAFACVESLFFQSLFAGIFYFRETNRLPGLCQANEFIMKDEFSHYEFAVYLYNNYIENKLPKERVKEIILSCLDTELEFTDNIMPEGLLGLTKEMMKDYCRFIADTVLSNFGCDTVFNIKQPLAYMEKLAIPRKTNFFEKRVAEYTRTNDSEMRFDANF